MGAQLKCHLLAVLEREVFLLLPFYDAGVSEQSHTIGFWATICHNHSTLPSEGKSSYSLFPVGKATSKHEAGLLNVLFFFKSKYNFVLEKLYPAEKLK